MVQLEVCTRREVQSPGHNYDGSTTTGTRGRGSLSPQRNGRLDNVKKGRNNAGLHDTVNRGVILTIEEHHLTIIFRESLSVQGLNFGNTLVDGVT